MHEQSLIKEVINKVLKESKRHKAKKVLKVKVKIGQLSHFSVDSFKEHFYAAAQGTPAAKASLEAAILPAKARCLSCKKEFELGHSSIRCPLCRSSDFEITCGKEVLVEEIVVEGRP